jgi:hypothetical protein
MNGLRLYLYGRADVELWSLLEGAELQNVVGDHLAGREARSDGAGTVPDAALIRGLLADDGGCYVPGARMVLVPAGPEREVRQLMEPLLDRYAEVAAAVIPRLRRAYEATAAAYRFTWEQVSHALVAGMLLDLAVGSELWRSGWIRRQHWETAVWAFERVSAANAFGVRWVGDTAGRCGFAQLWHRDVKRPNLRLDEGMVALLGRLAAGNRPTAAPPKSLLYLRYVKLLEQQDRELRLAVPAFDAGDFDRLLVPMVAGARSLVAEAVAPALERAMAHSWWGRQGDQGSHCHAAVRLMLEYGIDRVIAEGLLAPFPRGAAEPAWGRWVWVESGGPLTLVAGAFDGVEVAGP